MTIKNNENQPAFPISEEQTDRINDGVLIYTGLTKREYFAAMALQGLLSIYDEGGGLYANNDSVQYMAKLSVFASDQLLKQLEKQ